MRVYVFARFLWVPPTHHTHNSRRSPRWRSRNKEVGRFVKAVSRAADGSYLTKAVSPAAENHWIGSLTAERKVR